MKFRKAARNVTLICTQVLENIVTVTSSKFKYLNIQVLNRWACPVCNIEMEGRQPGRATGNKMLRAETAVLRMPHYEVESQGWVQDKQPTKHFS